MVLYTRIQLAYNACRREQRPTVIEKNASKTCYPVVGAYFATRVRPVIRVNYLGTGRPCARTRVVFPRAFSPWPPVVSDGKRIAIVTPEVF